MRFVPPRLSEEPPISMTNAPDSHTVSGAASVSARTKDKSAVVMRNETVRLSPGASAKLSLIGSNGKHRSATVKLGQFPSSAG